MPPSPSLPASYSTVSHPARYRYCIASHSYRITVALLSHNYCIAIVFLIKPAGTCIPDQACPDQARQHPIKPASAHIFYSLPAYIFPEPEARQHTYSQRHKRTRILIPF